MEKNLDRKENINQNENKRDLKEIEIYLKSRIEALRALYRLRENQERMEEEAEAIVRFVSRKLEEYTLLANFEMVVEIGELCKRYLNQEIDIREPLINRYNRLKEEVIELFAEIKDNKLNRQRFADFIKNNFLIEGEEIDDNDVGQIINVVIQSFERAQTFNPESVIYSAIDRVLRYKKGKIREVKPIIDSTGNVVGVISDDKGLIDTIRRIVGESQEL